jgi:hypothetical protein
VLIVMMTEPTVIRQNTILNTKLAVSSLEPPELAKDSVRDSSRQRISGPHRSQSRSPLAFSSRTRGINTYFNLKPIFLTSRMIVVVTGSSSVFDAGAAPSRCFTETSLPILSCRLMFPARSAILINIRILVYVVGRRNYLLYFLSTFLRFFTKLEPPSSSVILYSARFSESV